MELTINLKVKDKEFNLTVEEARELLNLLKTTLEQGNIVYPYPQIEPTPMPWTVTYGTSR